MEFLSKKFWDVVLCKIVETLISVKVWVIFMTFIFSGYLTIEIVKHEAWDALGIIATIITGVITPVVIMREGFKISKINKSKEIEKKKLENGEISDEPIKPEELV